MRQSDKKNCTKAALIMFVSTGEVGSRASLSVGKWENLSKRDLARFEPSTAGPKSLDKLNHAPNCKALFFTGWSYPFILNQTNTYSRGRRAA